MKKNKAWTLAELTICITVLFILAGVGISVIKPGTNTKTRLFVYAIMKNLSAANSSLIQFYDDTYAITEKDAAGTACLPEAYCSRVTDLFTVTGTINCAAKLSGTTCVSDVATTTANMVLPNGVEVYGLANDWKNDSTNTYKVKDIKVDIDGAKGLNKLWVDQFPLRVYQSGYGDTLRAVKCGSTAAETSDGVAHTYCGSSTTDYRKDEQVIKYEIYRATLPNAAGTIQAKLMASGLSELKANCLANTWKKAYPITDCSTNSYTVMAQCMNTGVPCVEGSTDICYKVSGTANYASNPDDLPCFVIMQKPHSGAGMLIDGMLDEIDI